jgi:hypothetical protein
MLDFQVQDLGCTWIGDFPHSGGMLWARVAAQFNPELTKSRNSTVPATSHTLHSSKPPGACRKYPTFCKFATERRFFVR